MAELYLRTARTANECGNRTEFLAACKLMHVALGSPELG